MPRKPRTGRPPKAPEDRRDRLVKTLVTVEEFGVLQAAAEREDRTLSDWLRITALRAAGASGGK